MQISSTNRKITTSNASVSSSESCMHRCPPHTSSSSNQSRSFPTAGSEPVELQSSLEGCFGLIRDREQLEQDWDVNRSMNRCALLESLRRYVRALLTQDNWWGGTRPLLMHRLHRTDLWINPDNIQSLSATNKLSNQLSALRRSCVHASSFNSMNHFLESFAQTQGNES